MGGRCSRARSSPDESKEARRCDAARGGPPSPPASPPLLPPPPGVAGVARLRTSSAERRRICGHLLMLGCSMFGVKLGGKVEPARRRRRGRGSRAPRPRRCPAAAPRGSGQRSTRGARTTPHLYRPACGTAPGAATGGVGRAREAAGRARAVEERSPSPAMTRLLKHAVRPRARVAAPAPALAEVGARHRAVPGHARAAGAAQKGKLEMRMGGSTRTPFAQPSRPGERKGTTPSRGRGCGCTPQPATQRGKQVSEGMKMKRAHAP